MKQSLPDWVLKYKDKGTQIVRIGGNYYLYKISSVWDPQKGRARKVTQKYLGKITSEGLIKPRHERIIEGLKEVSVKEYGASFYIMKFSSDIVELLKEYFPLYWRELFVFAVIRLFYSSALKNVQHYFSCSHLSDIFSDAKVSVKSLSNVIRDVGLRRQKVVEFLKNFLKSRQYRVIDMTHVFSYSEDVISSTLGYNSERQYIPQINLVMIFSIEGHEPGFFRIVTGSIRDVSVFQKTIKEASIDNAVIIADKGFYSDSNIAYLEEEGLRYIIPVKRNNSLIDYTPMISGNRREFDGFFLFEKRVIWYKEKVESGRRVILFFDEKLKAEEEKDIVGYIEDGRFCLERFYEIQHRLGSIAVVTNTDFRAQKIFELLKGRIEIEQSFDTFKNLLHGDRLYVRDDTSLQGWMFINFMALILYYRIYATLSKADLLKKYSVKDVIVHLSRIYKLRISDKWVLSEIPKTSRKLLEKLNIELHIT